jgi:ElaB/YqjD/DUF883 family membrane-anchored ribosome-binding protein
MKLENVAHSAEHLHNGVAEVAEKARDFSHKLKEGLDTATHEIRRGMRRTREAAEDAVEDARHGIKSHPLTAVAVTACGAFAVGMLAGWLVRARRD